MNIDILKSYYNGNGISTFEMETLKEELKISLEEKTPIMIDNVDMTGVALLTCLNFTNRSVSELFYYAELLKTNYDFIQQQSRNDLSYFLAFNYIVQGLTKHGTQYQITKAKERLNGLICNTDLNSIYGKIKIDNIKKSVSFLDSLIYKDYKDVYTVILNTLTFSFVKEYYVEKEIINIILKKSGLKLSDDKKSTHMIKELCVEGRCFYFNRIIEVYPQEFNQVVRDFFDHTEFYNSFLLACDDFNVFLSNIKNTNDDMLKIWLVEKMCQMNFNDFTEFYIKPSLKNKNLFNITEQDKDQKFTILTKFENDKLYFICNTKTATKKVYIEFIDNTSHLFDLDIVDYMGVIDFSPKTSFFVKVDYDTQYIDVKFE